MKQTGSIVVILNHSRNFFEDFFFLYFEVFSCLTTLFLDFYQEKLPCNADIEMPTVGNHPYQHNQKNYVTKILK